VPVKPPELGDGAIDECAQRRLVDEARAVSSPMPAPVTRATWPLKS
jgi:hypothetical protein